MSRLPKGMIRKRNSYFLRIRRTVDGKKVETTIALGPDEAVARAEYQRRRRRLLEWGDQPTVAEFSERWLKEYIAAMRTGKGPRVARQRVRDFIVPALGKKLVPEVSEADIMALRADLDKTKLSVMSVRHVLSDVRCLFRFAVSARLIDRSPFASRIMPKIQEEIPEPLSDVELVRVFQVCPKQYEPLIGLALWTGLRYSELRGLRWECVFLEEKEPHVLVIRSGHAEWTKSHRARRIPLLGEAIAFLAAAPRKSEYVFTGRFHGMIEEGTTGATREISRKVPGFHFHRLRHTFASRFVRAGGNLRVLQRILGHSSIKTTERYVRLFDADVAREMRSLPADWLRYIDGGEQAGNKRGTRS